MAAGPGPSTSRYGRSADEPTGELRFRFEITVLDGEEGRAVRSAQARAIKELLEWIHEQDQRNHNGSSESAESGGRAHETDGAES